MGKRQATFMLWFVGILALIACNGESRPYEISDALFRDLSWNLPDLHSGLFHRVDCFRGHVCYYAISFFSEGGAKCQDRLG